MVHSQHDYPFLIAITGKKRQEEVSSGRERVPIFFLLKGLNNWNRILATAAKLRVQPEWSA
jgi:hypothetical protein